MRDMSTPPPPRHIYTRRPGHVSWHSAVYSSTGCCELCLGKSVVGPGYRNEGANLEGRGCFLTGYRALDARPVLGLTQAFCGLTFL